MRLWHAATGAELLSLTGRIGWVPAVAFAPHPRLAGAAYNTVRLGDAATGARVRSLIRWVGGVAFAPRASGGGDGTGAATGRGQRLRAVLAARCPRVVQVL